MQHKHINPFLIILLAAACVFMAVNLIVMRYSTAHIPDSAVQDVVSILAEDHIRIDPALITTQQANGTVYVCDSVNYNETVARLLSQSEAEAAYVIPDGEILIMENGARLEFGQSFSFLYDKNGEGSKVPDYFDPSLSSSPVNEEKRMEISAIAAAFLDSGSGEFDSSANISIVTSAETVWENAGLYYAYCSRSIDGIPITENHALCVISGGEVVKAYGSWSFLTLGESYFTQLSDLINILFHVRSDIAAVAESKASDRPVVTIESVNRCYALYFYGDSEDFCLIPCWQVVTDCMGEFIYNAIDATLYTNISR